MKDSKKAEGKEQKYREQKNVLEYVVFFVSLAIVLALLVYLTHTTITVKNTAPQLEVEYRPKPQIASPYLYQLSVRNIGNTTAEDVIVELVQESNGERIEVSQMTIMYVSGETSVDGWMNFTKDPSEADTVYARIVSYKSS